MTGLQTGLCIHCRHSLFDFASAGILNMIGAYAVFQGLNGLYEQQELFVHQ
jgi:hypothetical protein